VREKVTSYPTAVVVPEQEGQGITFGSLLLFQQLVDAAFLLLF
jgi:hypothetical protein